MFDAPSPDRDGIAGAIGPHRQRSTDRADHGRTRMRDVDAAQAFAKRSRHRAIARGDDGAAAGIVPGQRDRFHPAVRPAGAAGRQRAPGGDRAAPGARRPGPRGRARRPARAATAFNVVAEVRGTRPELKPVCVMTPRSGWYLNASERGGGLACWLEALRAVAATRPRRTVRFVASSGHELGHLGLHSYLDRNPSLASGALVWVHLGANIGTSTGPTAMTCLRRSAGAAAHARARAYGIDASARAPAAQVGGEALTIRAQRRALHLVHRPQRLVSQPARPVAGCRRPRAVARFALAVSDLTLALADTAI